MGSISLRLPESLHKQARELAEKEDISINQLIATALAEKMAALMTGEYLAERARRAADVSSIAFSGRFACETRSLWRAMSASVGIASSGITSR